VGFLGCRIAVLTCPKHTRFDDEIIGIALALADQSEP
jgi:hypothetical protein